MAWQRLPSLLTATLLPYSANAWSFSSSITYRNVAVSLRVHALSLQSSRLYSSSQQKREGLVTTDFPTTGKAHPFPTKPVGIIFDMDGTITKPCIDFANMRSRIYAICDSDPRTQNLRGDVLELVSELSEEQQAEAKRVFDDIERKAIEDMQIMDGIIEFLQHLDDFGIRRAVLTRNVGTSIIAMQDLMRRNAEANGGVLLKSFDPVVARDTIARNSQTGEIETLKSKPEPDAILHICEQWGCHPADVIMIGDSAADDVACAYRAGCSSVLIQTGKDNDAGGGAAATAEEMEERVPTVSVNAIAEFHELFSSTFRGH